MTDHKPVLLPLDVTVASGRAVFVCSECGVTWSYVGGVTVRALRGPFKNRYVMARTVMMGCDDEIVARVLRS